MSGFKWIALAAAFSSGLTFAAETITKDTRVTDVARTLPAKLNDETSQLVTSLRDDAQSELAAIWGLNLKEWERYENLMQGPRGIWSPGLDPLSVLGIEAKTEAERTRYAELQVQMEFARVESELAYQRAYDAAFKRLYPNVLPIGNKRSDLLQNVPDVGAFSAPATPLAVFVSTQCKSCDSYVKSLQSTNTRFDVYVMDSNGKDDSIRNWASRAGINPTKVKERQITLNHNNGEFKQVAGESANKSDLPLAFKRVGQRWEKVY